MNNEKMNTDRMNQDVLRHLFTQHNVDSGAISLLGPVVHQFTKPGVYQGEALLNERPAGRFFLWVEDACPASQVDIDLSNLPAWAGNCCDDKAGARFVVNPKGYAVFHVSSSRGGYAVVVRQTGEKAETVFDSRELGPGDVFAASLLRPGRYQVTNTITGAKGVVEVAYPRVGEKPRQRPEPVTVECHEKEFRPARIRLESAQGQVYQMHGRGRLRIELLEPDDGPSAGKVPHYAAWGKPPDEPPVRKPTPKAAAKPRTRAKSKKT
jgi:hypothetical protein